MILLKFSDIKSALPSRYLISLAHIIAILAEGL